MRFVAIATVEKNTDEKDFTVPINIQRYEKVNTDNLLLLLLPLISSSSCCVLLFIHKDTGIKTRIIKQYLPIINKLINKYLGAMDFYITFELDESFNETIRSRHRDEFTYDSFSEGEKMRIDLALLFTWRAVAKLKNSVNTNLLVLDEVFDSSLDTSGTDEFLKILYDLTHGTSSNINVFVISHKGEILYDKFEKTIKFEKHKNFSRLTV